MKLVEHSGQGAMVVMDLCAPGASVRVTKYAERKATPEEWASAHNVQAATNGDFFDFPGWTYVIGRARGAGEDWPAGDQNKEPDRPYWQFGPKIADWVAVGSSAAPRAGVTEIVGGHNVIVMNGKTTGPWAPANDGALLNTLHNRTGFGISKDRRTAYLASTSDAITAQTLVDRMLAWAVEAGAAPVDYATNMDGGGSSQLYVQGRGQIVTSGRQVNDHVGFIAAGTGPSPMCVPVYEGDFVKQSFPAATAAPIPLGLGQQLDGYIELKNMGTSTWTPGKTKLAPTPRDKASGAGGVGWLAPTRVSTVAAPVPPGQIGHFPLKLAPTELGDHVYHFGLVEEGVTWFADATLGGGPADTFLAVHLNVTPGAQDAGTGATGGLPNEGDPGGASDGGGAGAGGAGDQASDDSGGGCDVARAHGGSGELDGVLGLLLGLAAFARRRARS